MTPPAASARALSRRLPAPGDLLGLFARLTDGGRRADSLMIETTAGASILMDQAAVRIECRGHDLVLHRLSSGGEAILRLVERSLPGAVRQREEAMLALRFERSDEPDPTRRLIAPSPLDALRTIARIANQTPEEPFAVCLLGVVAFDHVDLFENLPPPAEDPHGFPDLLFWLAESAIVVEPGLAPRLVCTSFGADDPAEARRNHFAAMQRLTELAERLADGAVPPADVAPAPRDAAPGMAEVEVDQDDDAFAATVVRLKEHIAAGDVYQIVPSRTFTIACADPLAAFARQRAADRSPYMFYVAARDHVLFGSSPETSVRVRRHDGGLAVEVKPIAGTRARGADADEDDRMEADLRLDQKEVAEHMMLVDLARNDVAMVSVPGTRRVAELMTVERFARVMHLVSLVRGTLAPGLDALHALQACLNVGTLSGAPKLKATELLRRCERTRRGPYGGAVGWLSGTGEMDSGVIIRSALVTNGRASVRAGAGVVHDSDPHAEAEETRRKASAVLMAIAGEEDGR